MDRDGFSAEHPMLKRALSKEKCSTGDNLKNLVEFRDGFVFVWSAEDGALLVTSVNSTDDSYQTLRLISAPTFPVERVSVVGGCARACVWGARGVVAVELPFRLAGGSSDPVLCKSCSLDERFLLSQAEVRRVHWHPLSLSHLLVLVSDNTIRLYNVALKSVSKLVRAISIGPTPQSRLSGRPILESLGDTAVDFELLPGAGGGLLVLRGNGDVYAVNVAVGDDSAPSQRLRGPLPMFPPADDNYGEDSCALLVLGGAGDAPPMLIIATCSAILYHCLLLPDRDKSQESDSCDLSLYVVESVELNLILNSDETSLQYSYPVHLYPIGNRSERYMCMHAAGIHTVSLPLMSELKEFVNADDDDTEGALSALLSRGSTARYLVCTHAPSSAGTLEPPVGVCCLPPAGTPTLLVLLQGGRGVTRSLEPLSMEEHMFSSLQIGGSNQQQLQQINSLLKEREKMSFSAIIQDILTRDTSQPILKMAANDEPSPKESVELLATTTMTLQSEYMARQERAAGVIRHKLRDLATLCHQQRDWFKRVQVQAEDVTAKAATLREKCAGLIKKQAQLRERCWTAIRMLRSDSAPSAAEKDLLIELKAIQRDVDRDADTIERLRDASSASKAELKKLRDEYKKKEIFLGRSHSDTISAVIQQQSAQLSAIIEDTKLLKDQLSIA